MPSRLTVPQRIAREIYNKILLRQYLPGQRLPTEREMAVTYGISRIPVREAIKILEQQGVVESRHGSGNYVKHIGEDKIAAQISQYFMLCGSNAQDMTELWQILEVSAIRTIAENRTQEQYKIIKRLVDDCEAEVKSALERQPYAFGETDYALHSTIGLFSGNKILSGMISSFHKNSTFKQKLLEKRPEELSKLLGIHSAMLKGIEKRDPEMAAQALREDLNIGKKLFEDFSDTHNMSEMFSS